MDVMLNLDREKGGRRGTWTISKDHESCSEKHNNNSKLIQLKSKRYSSESICSYQNADNMAIVVKNAVYSHKGWKDVPVLKGLYMNIAKGSIYGLTGSSGCGKTTLISCILGIQTLQSGEIILFGTNQNTPTCENLPQIRGKDVGYMPQDIALYPQFTILEMITFFGRLYNIPKNNLEKETSSLLAFLQLSDMSNAVVGSLSGGQKRRVSLAISLIHSPRLLVLDEPTVGIDPLLRVKIWERLRHMVDTLGTTVVLTTHYVEEMRKADRVGVMNFGRITVEDTPNALLSKSNTQNLNDALLAFRKDPRLTYTSRPESRRSSIADYSDMLESRKSAKRKLCPSSIDLTMATTLTRKNIKMLLRNIPVLLFFTFMPSIQQLITLMNGDEPTNIKFGVVNEELNNLSSCPSVNTTLASVESCHLTLLGCYFTSMLSEETVSLTYYQTEGDAVDAIQNGHAYGYVHFSSNFSESLTDRALSRQGNASLPDSIYESSSIKIQYDRSNALIYYFLQKEFLQVQELFMSRLSGFCLGNEQLGTYPMKAMQPIFGDADEFLYSEYCSLGVALTIILIVTFVTSGLRLLTEKNSGMLSRLCMSGVQLPEIVIAHFASELCLLFVQSWLILGMLLWRTPPVTIDVFSVAFGYYQIFFTGCTGIVLGFLLGSVLSDPMQLSIVAITFIVPNICVSGVIWPLEALPACLQLIVPVLPCTLTTESLRWVWYRDLKEISHPYVWPGLIVLPMYCFVLGLLTSFVYKLKLFL